MDFLRRSPRRAELVSRLAGRLRRQSATQDAIEQALTDLERDHAILVREHYCADPHLEGADLRVAAAIGVGNEPSEDPVAQAAAQLDAVWQQWLSEYLGSHSCT